MPTEFRVSPRRTDAGCQRSAAASRSGSPPPVGVAQRSALPTGAGARSAQAWDAIVVGASFAGLAVAMELAGAGRVLRELRPAASR